MISYTGYEYLLIDIANQYGWDKLPFDQRLKKIFPHLTDLDSLIPTAENPVTFQKAVMTLRAAQSGHRTGHLVTLDAVCSGIQIMSALTGCISGARATGLVDPDVRSDAYSEITTVMNNILVKQGHKGVSFPREEVKYAVMTCVYGSTLVPKILFGDKTPELAAFYEACMAVAPGAFSLLTDLLNSWRPYALAHQWVLPDGFVARVKVMEVTEHRIEVDELDHATFTYEYRENQGSKYGRANVANVIHSVDAYILRALVRRCSYDKPKVLHTHCLITAELLERSWGVTRASTSAPVPYLEHYARSGIADPVILAHLTEDNIRQLETRHLQNLNYFCEEMLAYQPFPVITVHDAFGCHPNNMNVVRFWYKEILAELAESNLIGDLLTQITGVPGTYPKLSNNLPDLIRQSNYALC